MVSALLKAKLINPKDAVAVDGVLSKTWDDAVAITWTITDVIDHGRNMGRKTRITKGEARHVLDYVLRKHDATQGVSWDTIEYAINEICGTT